MKAYEQEKTCYEREFDRCKDNGACMNDILKEIDVVDENLKTAIDCRRDPISCRRK